MEHSMHQMGKKGHMMKDSEMGMSDKKEWGDKGWKAKKGKKGKGKGNKRSKGRRVKEKKVKYAEEE